MYPRARSSVGRTFDWQSKGRGFESPRVHQVYGSKEELPLMDLLVALLGLAITDKTLREAVNRLEPKPGESIKSDTKLQEMLQIKILLYKPTSDIGLAYRLLLDQFQAQQLH